MGNEMTVTTPISSSRKKADELEKKRQKTFKQNKKTETENTSKKAEKKTAEDTKKAADEKTAINVFNQATANIKVENYTNYNDYKAACEDAFQKEVDARKKTDDTTDDLTPEQIKIAKNYMKSNEFKAAKKDIEFNNQNHIRSLQTADNVDGVTKGERKKQTDAILKQNYEAKEANLKKQYESQKIDKATYKKLRKENEAEYKAYKKANGTTSAFQRFFGKKETAGDRIHKVGAKQENLAVTREFMTSGKDGAIESRIEPELMAKLKAAGYKATPKLMEKLYEIYDDNSGTDATVNYSYKPKQEGERDQLLARLNENLPKGAEKFTMKDVKDLGRALGYEVEKAVDAGIVLRDMGRAAIPGLGLIPLKSEAKATAIATDAIAKDKAVVPTGAILFGVAEGVAGGLSAYQQYHRVEDRAIPTNVPETVKRIDEYNDYLDNYATEEGARLGKGIAQHYINPYTNEFDIEQMNTALKQASGTVDPTGTPCNYEEAEALLTGLESGKIKPRFEKPVDPTPVEEVKPVYQVTNNPVDDTRDIQTYKYTVKKWDDWNTVLRNKYTCADPKKVVRYFKDKAYNELKEKGELPAGVTSSRGAFFYPVGYEWELPDYIEIDGQRCNYVDNTVPQNNRSNGSTKTIRHNSRFQENYQRDSWNGYDITNDGNRQVAKDQASQGAVTTIINNDAAKQYPGAKKVEIKVAE